MRPVTFLGIFVALGVNVSLYPYMMLFAHALENIARLAIADVTVDGIAPATTPLASGVTFPTLAASISIVGITSLSVQPNGATVYAETEVETEFAFISGTSTLTLLSTPTTIIGKFGADLILTSVLIPSNLCPATFAEDASLYSISEAVTTTFMGNVVVVGDELVCSGTSGAEVTCVEENVQSVGGQVETGTATISGVRTPAFTIKTSAARARLPTSMVSFMAAAGLVCGRFLGSMY